MSLVFCSISEWDLACAIWWDGGVCLDVRKTFLLVDALSLFSLPSTKLYFPHNFILFVRPLEPIFVQVK